MSQYKCSVFQYIPIANEKLLLEAAFIFVLLLALFLTTDRILSESVTNYGYTKIKLGEF